MKEKIEEFTYHNLPRKGIASVRGSTFTEMDAQLIGVDGMSDYVARERKFLYRSLVAGKIRSAGIPYPSRHLYYETPTDRYRLVRSESDWMCHIYLFDQIFSDRLTLLYFFSMHQEVVPVEHVRDGYYRLDAQHEERFPIRWRYAQQKQFAGIYLLRDGVPKPILNHEQVPASLRVKGWLQVEEEQEGALTVIP